MRFPALLTGIVAILGCSQAFACDCARVNPNSLESVQAQLDLADVVYLGRAETVTTAARDDEIHLGATIQTTVFSVFESWKGDRTDQLITKIDIQCCICGTHFVEGETYLVFAYKTGDSSYSTSICTMTMEKARAKNTIDILNGLTKPNEKH